MFKDYILFDDKAVYFKLKNLEKISELSKKSHILVVDDDERLRALLSRFLRENDFLVTTCVDAKDARNKLDVLDVDLIILDVMMPGEDGVSLTSSLKNNNLDTPIILLTALGEVDDRIKGLESGADDYLPKPFEPKELLLRVNSILKRTSHISAKKNKDKMLGDYKFDVDRGELIFEDNNRIILTQVELKLLKALFDKSGTVISREDLAEMCGIDSSERTVDVQITRLRKKIEIDSKQPKYIQTIRGKGYILRVD